MPTKRNTRQKLHRSFNDVLHDLDSIMNRLELSYDVYDPNYPVQAKMLSRIIIRLYIEREMLSQFKNKVI